MRFALDINIKQIRICLIYNGGHVLAETGIGQYVNVTRFFVAHAVLFANDGANIQKRIDIVVLLVRFLAFRAVIHLVLSSYKSEFLDPDLRDNFPRSELFALNPGHVFPRSELFA